MSMNSALRDRLARPGPVRDADPPPSFSGDEVSLVLRRVGRLDKRVSAIRRLHAAGLTLRAAHAVIGRLAEQDLAVCGVAGDASIPSLAADLAALNIHVHRRRAMDVKLIARVRKRHGLSQREFAELLGLDVNTLQNWEQGRNKPDAAALSLVLAFDQAPDMVSGVALERVI